jgi:hypothetical protein
LQEVIKQLDFAKLRFFCIILKSLLPLQIAHCWKKDAANCIDLIIKDKPNSNASPTANRMLFVDLDFEN